MFHVYIHFLLNNSILKLKFWVSFEVILINSRSYIEQKDLFTRGSPMHCILIIFLRKGNTVSSAIGQYQRGCRYCQYWREPIQCKHTNAKATQEYQYSASILENDPEFHQSIRVILFYVNSEYIRHN